MPIKNFIYITLGILSIITAMIGIILPLLPTTPFLLLATYFFANSSEKFHSWLINHKLFGSYIRNYNEEKGMILKHKVISLLTLHAGIGYTIFFAMRSINPSKLMWIRVFLVSVLIMVTIHILKLKLIRVESKLES